MKAWIALASLAALFGVGACNASSGSSSGSCPPGVPCNCKCPSSDTGECQCDGFSERVCPGSVAGGQRCDPDAGSCMGCSQNAGFACSCQTSCYVDAGGPCWECVGTEYSCQTASP